MTIKALIFDCDGVLADTERFGHLPAFNHTFEKFGLPVRWSTDEYRELIKIGGGKERLSSLFDKSLRGTPWDRNDSERQELVANWHRVKTSEYIRIVTDSRFPGRPGVKRLAREAANAGLKLAVASTSATESVKTVLEQVVGLELSSQFKIFAGDIVPNKKPAPDIYLYTLSYLKVSASEAVVIEDSEIGCRAAKAAGITTVATPNDFTNDDDFRMADLVVPSLGNENEVNAVTLDVLHKLVDNQLGTH